MAKPDNIVDMILEPIEMAAEVHRGNKTPEKYQWMASLSADALSLFIQELQVKTEEVLRLFFETHSVDVFDLLEVWLTDQAENLYVHPENPKQPEDLA